MQSLRDHASKFLMAGVGSLAALSYRFAEYGRRKLAEKEQQPGGLLQGLDSLRSVSVGKGSYGRVQVIGAGQADLSIGPFVSISPGVLFVLANHNTESASLYPFHNVDWRNNRMRRIPSVDFHAKSKGNVEIGAGSWLGYESIILPGVTVGEGAVIGARAVVTSDVPPYAVVAGNPAVLKKYRGSRPDMEKLLSCNIYELVDDELPYPEWMYNLAIPDFLVAVENRNRPKP